MNLTEKTAYIKGLADGLNVGTETAAGKLISALIDIVDEMANEITRLNDYIEEIDECLGDVEDFIVDEFELDDEGCGCGCDDDCDCDCCDCDDDCDCGCEDFFEAECPACHETFEIDADELDDEDATIVCPHCGQKLVFDEDELEGEEN